MEKSLSIQQRRILGAALDSALLRALAEPARQQILQILLEHDELDVGGISNHLVQDRSVVSRHLRTLEQAGVVAGRREGRRVVYRLQGWQTLDRLQGLLDTLRKVLTQCCPR